MPELFLKTVENSITSEIFVNVSKDLRRDTVLDIPFLVKQSMTTLFEKSLASNGPYASTPRTVNINSLVDNSV